MSVSDEPHRGGSNTAARRGRNRRASQSFEGRGVSGSEKNSPPQKPPEFLLKLLKMFKEVPEFTRWEEGKIVVSPPPKPSDVADILKRYFRSAKFTSFQRQLTNFNFRIAVGEGPRHVRVYVNKSLIGQSADALLTLRREGPETHSHDYIHGSIKRNTDRATRGNVVENYRNSTAKHRGAPASRYTARCSMDDEDMSYNFSPVNNSKMDLDEDGFVAIDWGRFKPPCPRVSYDDYLENMSVISEDGQPSNECSHDNQQQKYPRIYL